jgi:hypothetical protein
MCSMCSKHEHVFHFPNHKNSQLGELAVDYVTTPATAARSDNLRASFGRDLVLLASAKHERFATTSGGGQPQQGRGR